MAVGPASATGPDGSWVLADLPVTHGAVSRLHDECLLLALSPQLLHVILELGVLRRKDPGLGYEAVLLRLKFNHSM